MRHQHLGFAGVAPALALLAACASGISLHQSDQQVRDRYNAYLLKVMPPCEDLQFANRIGISSTTGTVYSRLDSVIAGHWRCQIAEIRKIDYQRMRADMRAQR